MLRVVAFLVAAAATSGLVVPARVAGPKAASGSRPASTRGAPLRALRLDQPLLKVKQISGLGGGPLLVLGGAAAAVTAAVGASGLAAAAAAALPGSAGLPEWAKVRYGSLRALAESARLGWADLWDDDSLTVLGDTWAPCALESREDFGDAGDGAAAYTAYRFALKQGARTALPLELGQEVTFVGLDDRNRPVRASFPPANARREAGYVDGVQIYL